MLVDGEPGGTVPRAGPVIATLVRSLVRGHTKTVSSSRALMWGFAGAAFAILLAVLVPIYLDQLGVTDTGIEWAPFEGPLDWVRDLVFISILPFLGSELAGAVERRAPALSRDVNVETVEKVDVA